MTKNPEFRILKILRSRACNYLDFVLNSVQNRSTDDPKENDSRQSLGHSRRSLTEREIRIGSARS